MPRSLYIRRTALLSALTAFAIPEMHAEPSQHPQQWQQQERHAQQPVALNNGGPLRFEPTQRWVF